MYGSREWSRTTFGTTLLMISPMEENKVYVPSEQAPSGPCGFGVLDGLAKGVTVGFYSPGYPFPEAPLPDFGSIDFASIPQEDRENRMKEFILKDKFMSGLVNKSYDHEEVKKLLEATKDIDSQIRELNARRAEVVRKWATGELENNA